MKQIVIVSSHLQKIFKTVVLKIFAKLTEKHLLRSLFLISFKTTVFFQNETPTQVFSSEFCETFKNNIFTEYLRTTASVFMEHIFNIKKPKFSQYQNQINVKISFPSSLLTLQNLLTSTARNVSVFGVILACVQSEWGKVNTLFAQ